MPRVSVIIPTYNRAQLVARAVFSVLRQSFEDWEVLVVDDASRDDTERVLDQFAERTPRLAERFVYVRQPVNRGANAARNVGIARARGEYVAFLDSDDLWHPQKLARQLERIAHEEANNPGNKPVFTFTGRYRVDGDYNVLARQFAGSMRGAERRIRATNSIGTLSTVLVSTWLARHLTGFDETLPACQDWDFYIRAIPYCHVFGVREPLVMYYDAGIERISRDGRRRLASHLIMHRRYMRARTQPRELAEFYRNVAEDLERIGKLRLARRFYSGYKWLHGDLLDAVVVALGRADLNVQAERYGAYARTVGGHPLDGNDQTLLAEFNALLVAAESSCVGLRSPAFDS